MGRRPFKRVSGTNNILRGKKYNIINNRIIQIENSEEYDIKHIQEHLEDAKKVFAKQLVRNLGVYGIAGVIYEEKHGKLNESDCDKFASICEQGFESEDVTELYLMTEKDVERIIKEEYNNE